jgi:crotonobetainyl-CoA:carnitine CoA-transferase CaiB-like acyl-CoA transferase
MDLTGQGDGPPTLMGVPMIDLKAGDEVFAQTMRAVAEQAEGGKGTRIDISMARAAASWLQTTLPLLDLGAPPEGVRRSGNEHREFVPVNVYRTADSWLYVAIGNDTQWSRLTALAPFRSLARPGRETNEGRKAESRQIHVEMAAAIRPLQTGNLLDDLRGAGIVASPVNAVGAVREMAGIREHLTRTTLPDGRPVRLPPAAVETGRKEFFLSPGYGEHTRKVLEETGLKGTEIDDLIKRGVIH